MLANLSSPILRPKCTGHLGCSVLDNPSRSRLSRTGSPVLLCGHKATLILHLLYLSLYPNPRAGMHPSQAIWAAIPMCLHPAHSPSPIMHISTHLNRNVSHKRSSGNSSPSQSKVCIFSKFPARSCRFLTTRSSSRNSSGLGHER